MGMALKQSNASVCHTEIFVSFGKLFVGLFESTLSCEEDFDEWVRGNCTALSTET